MKSHSHHTSGSDSRAQPRRGQSSSGKVFFREEAQMQLRNDDFSEKRGMDDEEAINPRPVLKEPAVTRVHRLWLILQISLTELADAQTAGKTLLLGVSLRESLGEVSTGIRRQSKEEGPPSPRQGSPSQPTVGLSRT